MQVEKQGESLGQTVTNKLNQPENQQNQEINIEKCNKRELQHEKQIQK